MDQQTGISRELTEAVDQLHASLEGAAAAAGRIRALLPRLGAMSAAFGELEAIIASGRAGVGAAVAEPVSAPPRPTLVVSAPPPARQPRRTPKMMRGAADTQRAAAAVEAPPLAPDAAPPADGNGASASQAPVPLLGAAMGVAASEELIAFRLEFEARPGPLDLRAVDEAVSEHPAVRDVALLDYDGRRATLKVWILPSASAADVQDALTEKAQRTFDHGEGLSIIALEDVA